MLYGSPLYGRNLVDRELQVKKMGEDLGVLLEHPGFSTPHPNPLATFVKSRSCEIPFTPCGRSPLQQTMGSDPRGEDGEVKGRVRGMGVHHDVGALS